MLKCSTSLWSADLTNLGAEIERVEPYSERYHLDVADGHYTPTMLFFPDLVAALRPRTDRPFEIHLMATDPLAWVDPFVEAGVDVFIFCWDSLADPAAALQLVRDRGKQAGVSLLLSESVDLLEPHWDLLDIVTIIQTAVGIKGATMDDSVPDKIRQARRVVDKRGVDTVIQSDGGIRRDTVPLMKEAGADFIVPGSLMFKEDPREMREWLASL